MKFLFSLTLFLVLANAHLGMFKPAVDCAAEKTDEQLAMEAAKLESLKVNVPVACELLAEKEAEEAVTAQSVTEGDVETQKRRRKGPKGGRGRKSARGLMKHLDSEMCAVATASDEGLATVVEQVRSAMDPCTDSVTFETVNAKVKDMCVDKDEEETTEDDAEQTEEEALVEQLMAELLAVMGKGRKENQDVCDLSEEDLQLRYDAFFSADEEAINNHEAELGWRKMKVMNAMKNKFSEDSCTEDDGETETDVVEGSDAVVEGETEEDADEEVDPLVNLARRFLKRGGHRHGKMHGGRKPHMGGRKPGKDHGEEKKENPAQAVLDAYKCVPVTTDVVNEVFEKVQAAVEEAKDAEPVVEVVEPVVEVVEEEAKPKRRHSGRGGKGRGHRGRRGGKRGRKL